MKKQLLLFCLLALLGTTTPNLAASPPPPIYYVKIGGSDAAAGNSWATAFATLQKALSVATSGDQIWVAKGTYYPTADASGNLAPADVLTKTFVMKNEVAIYGGFVGNEAANYNLSTRNFVSNETILSGDIDGTPDVVTGSGSTLSISGNGGNVYHVFSNASGLTNTAILDGFTVSGGNANGTFPHDRGGGMWNNGSDTGNFCSPTIRNCNFTNNNASYAGGAIYNRGTGGNSSPQISNCTFSTNIASFAGGAIFQVGSSTTSYTACRFNYNRSLFGGAIAYHTNSPDADISTLTNCAFTGNVAALQGGAIQNGFTNSNGDRSLSLTGCLFADNVSATGGGAFNHGALSTSGNTPVDFKNCTFKNNTCIDPSGGGGAAFMSSVNANPASTATFTNCLIDGNRGFGTVNGDGGAILVYFSNIILINSTITNNQSGTTGGGVSIRSNTASAIIKNCILWNNTAATANNIYNGSGGSVNIQYSLLQEVACPANVTCGAGMLYNQNPLFVNLAGGDFQLQSGSPALDAGDNTANNTTTDLANSPRKVRVIDMGAYEKAMVVSGEPICFVGSPLKLKTDLTANVGDQYAWKGPNGFKSSSATPTKTKTVAKDAGIYSVTVTTTDGITITSTIRVYFGIGNVTATSNSPVCKGGTIQLLATAEFGATYSWTKQLGSTVYTGQNPTIPNAKVSDGGLYMVFITGDNGCMVKKEVLVTVSPVPCVGTRLASEEIEEIDMQINAYPNPVTNTLTVEVTLQKPSKLSLSLFNSVGKESGSWQLNEEATVHKTELNMSQLTGGVYLLQAQAGKQKVVKRVVKIQY